MLGLRAWGLELGVRGLKLCSVQIRVCQKHETSLAACVGPHFRFHVSSGDVGILSAGSVTFALAPPRGR